MPTGKPRVRDLAMTLVGTLMLSSVAVYNRYPFIFADTGGYLLLRNKGIRSFFYNLFAVCARPTHTLWTIVLVNSLLVLWMLRIALREVFAIASRLEFIVIVALLCVLTSLPWFVAFVMPDVFTATMVLGLFLIAFRLNALGRWERRFVIGVTLLAMLVHYTNVPIASALLLAWVVLRTMMRGRTGAVMPRLTIPAMLIAATVIGNLAMNYLTLGVAAYSPGGYAFILARLIDHRTGEAYLRETCPTRHWAACAYLDRMPMSGEDFLWTPDGLFKKSGFLAPRKEGMAIIEGTVAEHPFAVARDAFLDALTQLERVQTGNGLRPASINPSDPEIRMLYPADYDAFLNSRQGRGEFTHMRGLWVVHYNFLMISAFYAPFVALLLGSDRRWLPVEFMLTIGLLVVINAFATGPVSEPTNRYGSRIIWLVPLVAIASWRHALSLADYDQPETL